MLISIPMRALNAEPSSSEAECIQSFPIFEIKR